MIGQKIEFKTGSAHDHTRTGIVVDKYKGIREVATGYLVIDYYLVDVGNDEFCYQIVPDQVKFIIK